MSSDFTMVRPVAVTDAVLTTSSVPETAPAAYSAGTTYAMNATVNTGTVGGELTVWQSLQNGNVGNAPASSPAWWAKIGTVYAEYASGTSYAVDAIVQVAATHQVYQSLVAANLGNAVTDGTKWLPLGNTNRWKCFDKAVNSQTVAPESVTVSLTPSVLVNTVALLNIDGASATVQQSGSGYSQTTALQKHEVSNWYDWFYEDLVRSGDVVFSVPPYSGAVLTVTVNNPGSDAAIGCCFVGKGRILGKTQWGVSAGILSYSGTTTDAFGNTTLVKRSNAKKVNVSVLVPQGFESEAHRLLSQYTDTEMVFIGASDLPMSIVYGYLGNFEVKEDSLPVPIPIEIRGLI